MPKKLVATNMVLLQPTKSRPQPGDLFVCNMQGKRWIAGRVVHDRSKAAGGTHEVLVYFYKCEVTDPARLEPPIRPDLLIPPLIAGMWMWKYGFFKSIGNYPLQPREMLPRHVFVDGSVYCDEFGEVTPPRGSEEPWNYFGLNGYAEIDRQLSIALGIPVLPGEPWPGQLQSADVDSGEASVVLVIPAREDDPEFGLEEIEDPLIEAVENAGVGSWEGHGFDLRSSRWDVRFTSENPDRLAEIIIPILRAAEVPTGTHLLKVSRDGAMERVDL